MRDDSARDDGTANGAGPHPEGLDDLLAAWSRQTQLSEDDAERIRRTILRDHPPISSGLAPDWWEHFGGRIGRLITHAVRPVAVGSR